jgi:hypothetical protein
MRMKPDIEMLPQRALVPTRSTAVISPPVQMATVPAPMPAPMTLWGTRRQARRYERLKDVVVAQTGYLLARAELAKAFVAAAREANQVSELPEICESDTQVRRFQRERDHLNARREVEEARYGFHATVAEVEKIRRLQMEKVQASSNAAIDALVKAKVDREALGEDTSELDQTIAFLQRAQPHP